MSSPDSWQNALRRQYQRRDPDASPIGLMSRSKHAMVDSSRASTTPPGTLSELPFDELKRDNGSVERDRSPTAPSLDNVAFVEGSVEDPDRISIAKVEEEDSPSEILEEPEKQVDWLELSMLAKLESLHTLAEWQFQNPHRVRQQMKFDDEEATWVCRSACTLHPHVPNGWPLFSKYSALNPLDMTPREMHTG